MRKNIFLFLVGIIFAGCSQAKEHFFDTKDAYFGQTPPGTSAELFAPDIINHLAHSSPTFSPDGKEIYWSIVSGNNETRKIFYVKPKNPKSNIEKCWNNGFNLLNYNDLKKTTKQRKELPKK